MNKRWFRRSLLVVTIPFWYPYRIVQAMLGFPVDMDVVNDEIRYFWNLKDNEDND